MDRFELVLSPGASRDLDKLSDTLCSKIIRSMKTLEENPFPRGKLIKKIKGKQFDYYRLRADKHRVFYMFAGKKVIIMRILSKKDAERIIRGLD
jgi:mRNA interferase RelE/StbE